MSQTKTDASKQKKKKSPKKKFDDLELYFDESGDFMENSSDANEQASSKTKRQNGYSQYVGLLAKRGTLKSADAKAVLDQLKGYLGKDFDHATEFKGNPSDYHAAVTHAIDNIEKQKWQPVRLVNREGVSFGDRASTHLTLAAELVVRIFMQKKAEGFEAIKIRVIPAGVKLGTNPDGTPVLLTPEEYEQRLREAIGYVSVRRGHAYQSKLWIVDEVRPGSGKRWPELILCDLLSNSSYRGFRRLDNKTKAKLKRSLGAYDYTLQSFDVYERIEFLLEEGLIGSSLCLLIENWVSNAFNEKTNRAKLKNILERLIDLPHRARDHQLLQLVNWIEELVEGQRFEETGLRIVDLVLQEVAKPLQSELGTEAVAWFDYGVSFWGLTAANHSGFMMRGIDFHEKLVQNSSVVARQLEHSGLLTRGMIASAVHLTDARQFQSAAQMMESLVDYDRTVSKVFASEVFGQQTDPANISSNLRAQAIGTWLQAEVYSGVTSPDRLNVARNLSDLALKQFDDERDISRQWQYRCHLETVAQNFNSATECLAKALDCQPTHHDIADTIVEMINNGTDDQAFPILHWARLGTAILKAQDTAKNDFLANWCRKEIVGSPWTTGERIQFPAHGILRRVATISAFGGKIDDAKRTVNLLFNQLGGGGINRTPLELIRMAAISDVAIIRESKQPGSADAQGLFERAFQRIKGADLKISREQFPEVQPILLKWNSVLDSIVNNRDRKSAIEELSAITRRIDY